VSSINLKVEEAMTRVGPRGYGVGLIYKEVKTLLFKSIS
jgi:hypothetical protein